MLSGGWDDVRLEPHAFNILLDECGSTSLFIALDPYCHHLFLKLQPSGSVLAIAAALRAAEVKRPVRSARQLLFLSGLQLL